MTATELALQLLALLFLFTLFVAGPAFLLRKIVEHLQRAE